VRPGIHDRKMAGQIDQSASEWDGPRADDSMVQQMERNRKPNTDDSGNDTSTLLLRGALGSSFVCSAAAAPWLRSSWLTAVAWSTTSTNLPNTEYTLSHQQIQSGFHMLKETEKKPERTSGMHGAHRPRDSEPDRKTSINSKRRPHGLRVVTSIDSKRRPHAQRD
jgi:hypothetical protein